MCLILENCEAYFSELGHKGFFYPKIGKKVRLPRGTAINMLPWIPICDLVAIKVEKKNIFDLLQSSVPGKFAILWIEKNLITRSLHESEISRSYSR